MQTTGLCILHSVFFTLEVLLLYLLLLHFHTECCIFIVHKIFNDILRNGYIGYIYNSQVLKSAEINVFKCVNTAPKRNNISNNLSQELINLLLLTANRSTVKYFILLLLV